MDNETRRKPARNLTRDRYKAFLATIMRHFFTLFLVLLSINSFCQRIDKSEYILITKAVLSNEALVDTLKKYSHLDSHPVYDNDWVFVLDTTYINEEIYVKESSPKFCITNISELKSAYVNYWIIPTEIIFQNEKILYYFKTQSINRQDFATYISGLVTINQSDNDYQIENIKFEKYQFLEPYELECDRQIECETNLNYQKVSKTNSPLFGNWQFIDSEDGSYAEIFFSDDTIYWYSELWDRGWYDMKYELKNNNLIVYYPNKTVKRKIELIDKNHFRIIGSNILYENNSIFAKKSILMVKILESEFNQNDIKCWGKRSDKFDCYLESVDLYKFREAFWRRMQEFKVKNKENK